MIKNISTPKNIDSLIEYLNNEKGIAISGASQKRQLMNMGYYHGYKGYRYIKNPIKTIPYTKFDELVAIYEFDTQLKALFYPCVMKIETAFKNYVLEVIINNSHSDNFNYIYNNFLNNYKTFYPYKNTYPSKERKTEAENKYNKALIQKLSLRDRIYKIQTKSFENHNKIASHYINKDINLPIWAIFELLCLGDFGTFVSCLNKNYRKDISVKLGIRQSDDTAALLPQRLIFTIKDLRNAIAHNDVIFDTRFSLSDISSHISNAIINVTKVKNLSFETITDYLVLIIYILKLLEIPQEKLTEIISKFNAIVQTLRTNIPIAIFNQIIYTDNKNKIITLENFVKN